MNSEYSPKTRARGRRFEKMAEEFLLKKGFKTLARNWQAGHKEIDLIMADGDTVVFVEVKGSRSGKYGHPAEKVNARKRANLIAAARQYIASSTIKNAGYRFDLITVYRGELEYYPDAFQSDVT